jgi:hypothetical protein
VSATLVCSKCTPNGDIALGSHSANAHEWARASATPIGMLRPFDFIFCFLLEMMSRPKRLANHGYTGDEMACKQSPNFGGNRQSLSADNLEAPLRSARYKSARVICRVQEVSRKCVEHPRRKCCYDARFNLNVEDGSASPLLAVVSSDTLAVKRMPRIVNYNFPPDMGRMTA